MRHIRLPLISLRLPLISLILLAACGQPNTTGNPPQKQDNLPATKDSSATDTTHYTFAHADESSTHSDEDPTKPSITLSANLKTFVPAGYSALDTAGGDLNRDSFPDIILILRRTGEDTINVDSAIKRPLLILTGQPDGSLKLAARNDNAVLCYHCGGAMGDPYQETVIKKGYFSLEFYGGAADRWARTITFKYVSADSSWYLHKDSHDSFNATDEHAKHTIRVRSEKDFGKLPFTQFNADPVQ